MAALIRHVLLVVNPASRLGLRRRVAARATLQRAGVTVDELVTLHPGDAASRLPAAARDADAVFVLGGDGTVMEVAGALQGTGMRIGVLPGGTGNLVAGVLGIPGSARRAVPLLLAGQARTLDLGRLPGGRCFAFAAGVGIDVDMVLETSTARKRTLGRLAYLITAARSALRRRAFDVSVVVDGQELRARVVLAMVANAGSLFGGLLRMGPDIRPDDGMLDLCLFTPTTVGQVLGITWRVLRRDFSPHPNMRFLRGERIRLACDPAAPVQADGDVVGETPVEIEVLPASAVFLVPQGRMDRGG